MPSVSRHLQLVQAAALVDVDEVQADGLVPDADLAGAGFAHLHVDQFHLFGAALLADLDRFAHVSLLLQGAHRATNRTGPAQRLRPRLG